MSVEAIAWAIRQQTPSPGCKLILVLLANRANEDDACWPSMSRLERESGMSDRGVAKCLGQLVDARLVAVEQRAYQSGKTATNLFLLRTGVESGEKRAETGRKPSSNSVPPSVQPQNSVLPPPSPSPNSVRGVPELSSPPSPNSVRGVPELSSPKPSLNRKMEPTGGLRPPARVPARKASGDGPEFCAFWAGYPRAVGKGAARKAWSAAIARGASSAEILAGLSRQVDGFDQREGGRFIPLPATWLNQDRWEDRVKTASGSLDLDGYLARKAAREGGVCQTVIDGNAVESFQ